jgi:nitrite reductase/ring-hydroxylating ferredoxin subunit
MADWTTVASTADVPEGQLAGGTIDGEEIVVVNAGGQYRALNATCTHAGCNLADDGELQDGTIMCGCHGSEFDVTSGEVTSPPADEPLTTYEVRVEGEEVQVAAPGG